MFHKPKRRYNSEIVFSEDVNQGTVVERALTETDDQSDEDTDHEDEIDEANDCMAERIKNQQRMPLFNLSESQSRLIMTVTKTTLEGKSDFVDDLLERTALWKTVRVLAWIKRFVINYRSFQHFQRLNLQKNEERIYVCQGRIQGEYPIYVPSKHPVSLKIVKRAHLCTLHGGIGLTMSKVHDDYWIPTLRSLVKKVIAKCYGCKRFYTTVMPAPPLGNLPKKRTEGEIPFEIRGYLFIYSCYARRISFEINSNSKQIRRVEHEHMNKLPPN